jgi:hypothetical protein
MRFLYFNQAQEQIYFLAKQSEFAISLIFVETIAK